jgi:hypothetical protein
MSLLHAARTTAARFAAITGAVVLLSAAALPPSAAAPAGGASVLRVATLEDVGVAEFQNARLPDSVPEDHGVRFGSIGSDLFRAHGDPAGEFWMVTDRGPNGQPSGRRTFVVPEFTPTIVHVRVEGRRIEVLEAIPLRDAQGDPLTGLPNLPADEQPWNFDATETLDLDPNGLDTEGIVRTQEGEFWLVDEYRPSLVHVAADGRVLERFIPEGVALPGADYPVTDSLPGILAKRRANRGFEGVALTPDGSTLYLGMQSPLENPNRTTGRASRNVRILAFDIASESVTGAFVYRFEESCSFIGQPAVPNCGNAPGDMKLSSLFAIGPTQLLVEERTDAVAKVYLVDVSTATDILGDPWDAAATTPSLEGLADPATAGITVLGKSLLVDLDELPGVPAKIEGVAVVNPTTLAIANDNDFGLVDDTLFVDGVLANDTGARSHILYIHLSHPLIPPQPAQP